MVSIRNSICNKAEAARKLESERILKGYSYNNHLFIAKVFKNSFGLMEVGRLVVTTNFYGINSVFPIPQYLAEEEGLEDGYYKVGLIKPSNKDFELVKFPELWGELLMGVKLITEQAFELAKVSSEFEGAHLISYEDTND